jgi:hypothetical protein
MAITNSNIYQDLIMNPSYMPNRLQNLEMFPPVDTGMNVFSSGMYDDPNIPGYNFIDAPTSFINRIQNPQFLNNPRTGFIDNTLLKRGNPDVNLMTQTKDAITSGVGKGIDLGKSAIGGILSLVSGIPGIGVLANMLPERDYRQGAIEDFYSNPQTRSLMSQIPGMDQYNTVSGGLLNMLTGGKYGEETTYGLSNAIDKRISRIRKTLEKKQSVALENRIKALEELKRQEAASLQAARDKVSAELESQRRGDRPTAPTGGGVRDSGGPTGGYSYSGGKREGFGYGLKKGGLAGLL